eukprot:gene67696-92740_t
MGEPVRRIAMGGYILVDQRVSGDDARGIDLFLRAGLSEGNTTPFRGGFQVGALLRGFVPGRPDGRLSFGVAQGWLSQGFRDNLRDAGELPAAAETGFEISYQDRLASFLTVQPDLQYIRRAYDNGGERDTLPVEARRQCPGREIHLHHAAADRARGAGGRVNDRCRIGPPPRDAGGRVNDRC